MESNQERETEKISESEVGDMASIFGADDGETSETETPEDEVLAGTGKTETGMAETSKTETPDGNHPEDEGDTDDFSQEEADNVGGDLNLPSLIDVPEIPGFKMREEMRGEDDCIVQDVFVNDCYHIGVVPPAATILDVGAHLGCAAARYRKALPDAQIVCVEAHPENAAILARNTEADDHIIAIHGAVTYEPGELVIHGTIYDGCDNTGGSYVALASEAASPEYPTQHPVEKFTVEQIMEMMSWDYLDILKLDCEGSELSIIRNIDITKVGLIVGEWHNRQSFFDMLAEVFGINPTLGRNHVDQWRIDILKDAEIGLFRLNQPNWQYGRGVTASE